MKEIHESIVLLNQQRANHTYNRLIDGIRKYFLLVRPLCIGNMYHIGPHKQTLCPTFDLLESGHSSPGYQYIYFFF